MAPVNVSGGVVRLRTGLFHLATTRITPKKRHEVHYKGRGYACGGYEYARECRTDRSGQIEFDPVKRGGWRQVFLGHEFRNCIQSLTYNPLTTPVWDKLPFEGFAIPIAQVRPGFVCRFAKLQ